MKKSLIALAALATVATAAQAQSNVTLYGIVDAAVVRSSGPSAGSETELFSGGLSSSRWGVRGTEDLGGGLKAGFNLESELSTATGVAGGTTYNGVSSASGTFFNRLAFVNLSSAQFGTVQLGRNNRLDYNFAAKYDAFGGGNIVGLVRSGYVGGSAYNMTPSDRLDARYSQSLQYTSPSLGGLVLQYQRALGGQAGDTDKASADAFAAEYTAGKLSLAASHHDDKTSTGTTSSKTTGIFGAYDFGVLKLTAAHMEKKIESDGLKVKIDFLGAVIPVSAKVNVLATVGKVDNALNTAGAESDIYGLGVTYAFSKRTTGYVQYGHASNNALSANYVSSAATPATGKNATSTGVGIRHTF